MSETTTLAKAFDQASTAINRFVEAYDEFQKQRAIDRSIGGLRVVAERWLDTNVKHPEDNER